MQINKQKTFYIEVKGSRNPHVHLCLIQMTPL